MKKLLRILMVAAYSTAVICMIGCGENEKDAAFVSAYPPNNSTFEPGDTIAVTVTFDNTPVNIDIETKGLSTPPLWELDSRTLTMRKNTKKEWGDFDYVIIITWATGRKILNYAVRSPQSPPEVFVAPSAAFENAIPPSGDLAANGSISVTFDNNPGAVTASAGTVTGSGKSRIISGPFPVGALALNLTWENGGADGHTLNYTVKIADERAPEVTRSNPKDGQEGVDPAKVFKDGIEIIFSEPVTGDLMLMDGDEDVGWTSRADDKIITLTANAGQELSNETEYEIAGTVKDGAGNEAEVSITFVTRKN